MAISIPVPYGCDPRKVKAILLKVAHDNRNVMPTPEPVVDLEELGANGLNFKLYAVTYDLTKNVATRTDLRIAILESLHEAGIELRGQQTDVTIQNMDWVRGVIAEYVSGSHVDRASANGSHAASHVQSHLEAIAKAG